MAKRWSKAEIAHLKRHAESQSVEELAQRFHTDTDAVEEKLKELGLGAATAPNTDSEAVDDFAKGLKLLHDHKWEKAAQLFEKVVADADGFQLADRARQHLEICRARTEGGDDQGDKYLEAVFEKNKGNLDEALAICREQGAEKTDERFAYLMASIQALAGAEDEALELLEAAIRLEPKNRVHAHHDPDFQPLQEREEFTQLTQAP